MSKPKFTPGPYQVGPYRDLKTGERALAVWPANVPLFGRGNPICLISPEDKVDDQDNANAALIAAAPDLYAALQDALKNGLLCEQDHCPCPTGTLRQKIVAALAKAGGHSE